MNDLNQIRKLSGLKEVSAEKKLKKSKVLTENSEPMGTIKGGVWTADPPKKGEIGVPMPVPYEPTYKVDPKTGKYVPDIDYKLNPQLKPKPAAPVGKIKETSDLNAIKSLSGINALEENNHDDMLDDDVEMDMEEGNLFTKGLADDDVKIGDKIPGTNAIKRKDIDESDQLNECGDMNNDDYSMKSEPDRVNVTANLDSEGHQHITVDAEGQAANQLAQILKLSGLLKTDSAMPVDEEYVNEPDVKKMSIDSMLHSGNDLHKQKDSYSDRPYRGDNPMLEALEKRLWNEFQKVKKT